MEVTDLGPNGDTNALPALLTATFGLILYRTVQAHDTVLDNAHLAGGVSQEAVLCVVDGCFSINHR